MDLLAEIPSVGAEVPCENSRSSFLEAMHGGAGAAGPQVSARLQEDHESKAVYGTGPWLGSESEGRRGEEADPESRAAALSMVAGFIADGSSCMQASAAEQLAGEPSGTTSTGVSAPVVPLVVPDGVLAGHGGKLPGGEEQDREGETRSGGMMPRDVCAEDETGQETASDKEEDVLHLEGIIDDEATLLPAGEQNNDDCSDDSPPALDHLNLTASAAVFGGDETSSAVSEEDGAHASSMGSEDGDELQDEQDEDLMAGEGEGVSGEMPAEEECNSEMLRRVWMEKFARLEAFKSEHGHPHVRLDEPLGAWVLVQRQKLKQGRLSPERELMLREIGAQMFCLLVSSLLCNQRCLSPSISADSDPFWQASVLMANRPSSCAAQMTGVRGSPLRNRQGSVPVSPPLDAAPVPKARWPAAAGRVMWLFSHGECGANKSESLLVSSPVCRHQDHARKQANQIMARRPATTPRRRVAASRPRLMSRERERRSPSWRQAKMSRRSSRLQESSCPRAVPARGTPVGACAARTHTHTHTHTQCEFAALR